MSIKTTAAISVAILMATGAAWSREPEAAMVELVVLVKPQTVEFTPMTRSERLRNYLTATYGTRTLAESALHAGFEQLTNKPEEWGQGGKGLAERLGNGAAKRIIRGTVEYGISNALHEDDRYFVSGQTGFWNRTKYAVSSTFLARRVNGDRTLAVARFGGIASAAFVSNIWQPSSTSGMNHAGTSIGFSIAANAGSNVLREFWPDLKNKFRRK